MMVGCTSSPREENGKRLMNLLFADDGGDATIIAVHVLRCCSGLLGIAFILADCLV